MLIAESTLMITTEIQVQQNIPEHLKMGVQLWQSCLYPNRLHPPPPPKKIKNRKKTQHSNGVHITQIVHVIFPEISFMLIAESTPMTTTESQVQQNTPEHY